MLSGAELAVVDALTTRATATPEELAAVTDHSREYLYRVLDDLVQKGLLIESRGSQNQRHVRLTHAEVVEAYRHLVTQLGHVDWADLLTPATMRVLWFLDDARRVATIAARLDMSRQAVHDALSPLKGRAMLRSSGPEYGLVDELAPLSDFVHAAVTHAHRVRVRQVAPTAVVAWCDPRRALVKPHNPDGTESLQAADDWKVTGVAGFRRHDLKFVLPGEPAFWDAPGALEPAALVCHALLLDADVRRVSYAMLLVERAEISHDELVDVAAWYGLRDEAKTLVRACENGGAETTDAGALQLPGQAEYQSLRDQYDVA